MSQLAFNQVSPHVYWSSPDAATDRPILGVIAGAQGSLIVDAGNTPMHAHMLLEHIKQHNLSAPRFVALTHWHWDHVFGASALPWPTFAHRETARIVRKMAQLDWSDVALDQRVAEDVEITFCRDMIKAALPDRAHLVIRPPEIAFTDQVDIDLGGVTAQLIPVGGDHDPGSIVVYVPEDRVMFVGDCVCEDLYHGAPRYTTALLFPLLDRLLACDALTYLHAHDEQPSTREQLVDEATTLKAIGRTAERYAPDRPTILSALTDVLGAPLTEDHIAIIDAFLAGLRMPTVESVL